MESIRLAPYECWVHICLFCDVSNASDLRRRLIEASTLPDDGRGEAERAAVNYAFIDAASVVSVQHIMSAVHQALIARSNDAMRTKTVHSELIWYLEPGSNISDSLRHFGVSDKSTNLVLVKIGPESASAVLQGMSSLVQGTVSPLHRLGTQSVGFSAKATRKLYKLNNDFALQKPASAEAEVQTIDRIVSSLVAIKTVT